MKESGHLNPSEETGTGCPLLQSMEGHLQTSMEVWVDNNIYAISNILIIHYNWRYENINKTYT